MKLIDKSVPRFKKAFEFWSGSEHYKTGKVEPIDLAASGGYLLGGTKLVLNKYAFRLPNDRPIFTEEEKLKIKTDLLKIAHYAAMVYESLENE